MGLSSSHQPESKEITEGKKIRIQIVINPDSIEWMHVKTIEMPKALIGKHYHIHSGGYTICFVPDYIDECDIQDYIYTISTSDHIFERLTTRYNTYKEIVSFLNNNLMVVNDEGDVKFGKNPWIRVKNPENAENIPMTSILE